MREVQRRNSILGAKLTDRRAEIQGLRAIAVGSVLIFHIWPEILPGGFVGVDVFFVISGYLITGLLFREAEASGKINLSRFYERRIRRLLPAASAVLLVVAAGLPLLPRVVWEDVVYEIAASALYVENWRLAWLAVDYLGAENVASPLQHYWSLSIEEQFYIVWPAIMLGVLAVRSRRSLRSTLFAVLATIALASLAASIVLTKADQATAYFVTHTRIWELALGGLLSIIVLPAMSEALREALRCAGIVAIVFACFAFSSTTHFPGWKALLPTIGCALVIAAGSSHLRVSAYKLLAARPAQWLGDVSYSVYLWHWPLIVFSASFLHAQISSPGVGLAVVAASLVIASLSYTYIEQPFRRTSWRLRHALLAVGGSVGSVVTIACALLFMDQSSRSDIVQRPGDYPGALAIGFNAHVPPIQDFIPPLALVRRDLPEAYDSGCHLDQVLADLNPCKFGPQNGEFRVVLTGDSHAAHWIPALQALAEKRGWQVETYTKAACPLLVETVRKRAVPYQSCREWGSKVLDRIVEWRPDVVIFAQSSGARLHDSSLRMEDVVAATWRKLLQHGIRVVALGPTPVHRVKSPGCIQWDRTCASSREAVTADNKFAAAAEIEPRVPVIDMLDLICTSAECPMIVGNVVVWRDMHHLTATYSRTMAEFLGDRLLRALGAHNTALNSPLAGRP